VYSQLNNSVAMDSVPGGKRCAATLAEGTGASQSTNKFRTSTSWEACVGQNDKY
jgi:hypothetical protein